VKDNWSLPVRARHSIDVWKLKIKCLRQMLKGWNINVEGHYKELKKNLISKIDILDKASEVSGLSETDRLEKLDLEMNLRKFVDEKNIRLKQKARDKFMLDGDENSMCFHLLAKHKKRKLEILTLSHGDNMAQDENGINQLATSFYKNLFVPSQDSSISLDNLYMKRLDDDDIEFLTSPFSMEEVKDVVFSLKHNSAPGPDGFPSEFFRISGTQSKVICLISSNPFIMVPLILRDSTLGWSLLSQKFQMRLTSKPFTPFACSMSVIR
jgi:hypothetical protein